MKLACLFYLVSVWTLMAECLDVSDVRKEVDALYRKYNVNRDAVDASISINRDRSVVFEFEIPQRRQFYRAAISSNVVTVTLYEKNKTSRLVDAGVDMKLVEVFNRDLLTYRYSPLSITTGPKYIYVTIGAGQNQSYRFDYPWWVSPRKSDIPSGMLLGLNASDFRCVSNFTKIFGRYIFPNMMKLQSEHCVRTRTMPPEQKELSLSCGRLKADCSNVHCRFEYLGYQGVERFSKNDFMMESASSGQIDRYFGRECMPFRELNWWLFQLEESVCRNDKESITNAVYAVSCILDGYKGFLHEPGTGNVRSFVMRLRMLMIERIEYSLARMVIGEGRNIVKEYFDVLLPGAILEESRKLPSWHSVSTFRQMLFIAIEVENYHDKEQCYPLNLDVLKLPDKVRKCACGRDIEYEYYKGTWLLRSRCESWEGGLRFDEYIPMIYQQRKNLDLCFSRTFNIKRKSLFNGEFMGADDSRLRGQVVHGSQMAGVHLIKFTSPSAGCGMVVPLSEQAEREAKHPDFNKAERD